MVSLFGKVRWGLFNCVTGAFETIDKLPFEIGSGEDVDFRLEGEGLRGKHCALSKVKGQGLSIIKRDEAAQVLLNGSPVDCLELAVDTDYTLQIGAHLLAIHGSRKLETWRAGLDAGAWSMFDPERESTEGPWPPAELCRRARQQPRSPQTIVFPQGLAMGFFLPQLLTVFTEAPSPTNRAAEEAAAPAVAPPAPSWMPTIPTDRGSLTCPVCWLRFDPGDMMQVAVHDSLRGDPILGEDAPQRFYATRFNDRGQALDALGLPCTEMACPHCRRVLPPGFAEIRHHIFSIVGDQSAGKSYYLSVLVKVLAVSLYEQFAVVFQDGDPAGNAMLNDMKKALFGAHTPEQARLVKTQLEGAMYERLPRYGRTVALPKPFVFSLASCQESRRRCSVIFYDNAGEHFQPGRDTVDSPGAQHVASSAGIFFLFDPFNHPEFRRRMQIADQPDPQFEKPVMDQQDIILSELKVRIKKLLNLTAAQRLSTPLAVLCGKCDAWMRLLGEQPFRNPVESHRLNLDTVRHNSDRVRQLMLELCPTVVANAEEISDCIQYFPVSSFGHSPVKIGPGDYAPEPKRLNPLLVEVPPLWVLSRIVPELVPTQ